MRVIENSKNDNGIVTKYNSYELLIDDTNIENSDERIPVTLELSLNLINYIKTLREGYFKYMYGKNNQSKDTLVLRIDYDFARNIPLNGFDPNEITAELFEKYENAEHKENENILDELLQENWTEKYFDFFAIITKNGFYIEVKSEYGTISYSTELFEIKDEFNQIKGVA